MKWLASILFVTAAVASPQSPTGGTVEGQVVSTAHGEPIRKAAVLLRGLRQGANPPPTPPDNYITATDGTGKFRVDGVVPGVYECVPSRRGFGGRPPNQFGGTSFFPQIKVEAGQRVTGVTLRLTPLGVISGVVMSPEGQPIADAQVEALQYSFVNGGGQQLSTLRAATSNDRGEYRLYNLFPGTYYVRATVNDRFGFGGQIRGTRPTPLSPTFYPGVGDAAQARPVELLAAGEFSSTDIHMRREVLYSIRGTMPAPPSAPENGGVGLMGGLQVQRRPADPGMRMGYRTGLSPTGFEVGNLTPGTYMLTARRPDREHPENALVARAFVEVVNHDVEGVELTFAPPLEISGAIKVTGSARVTPENLRVVLEPVESGVQSGGPVKADGTFQVKDVLPDLYHVRVMPVAQGYVTSVKWGDRELKGRQVDLRRGGTGKLTVTVSAEMGRLQGLVTDDEGKPAAAINVTLIPDQDQPDWADRFLSRATGPLGKFVFPAVVPGHYTVFAWKDAPRQAPQDAAFRKPFEKLGTSVTVGTGDPQTLELKQIDASKPPKQ